MLGGEEQRGGVVQQLQQRQHLVIRLSERDKQQMMHFLCQRLVTLRARTVDVLWSLQLLTLVQEGAVVGGAYSLRTAP